MKLYEKMKDLSKRTLALYLVFSIVFMTLVYDLIAPLDVYAKVWDDNPPDGVIDALEDDDTMQNNWGTIKTSSGKIENNMGSVGTDGDGGYVTNNYGTVNNGSVENNYDVVSGESNVDHNWASGTVNDGWVNYNHHGTDAETRRGGLGDSVTTMAEDHRSDIHYMEWNAGPNPIPPKYDSSETEEEETNKEPAKKEEKQTDSVEQEEIYTEPNKQEEDDTSLVSAYDPVKAGFDSLKIATKTGGLESMGNSVSIYMGNTVSYTPDMIQALIDANSKGASVSMSMRSDGREFTFTIPAGADLTLIRQYLDTMDFASQGYSFLLNLIPGASLSYIDDNGDEVVLTNNMSSDQADNLLAQAYDLYMSMTTEELYKYCEAIYGADFAKMLNSAKLKAYTTANAGTSVESFPLAGIGEVSGASTAIRSGRTANGSGVLGVRSEDPDPDKKTVEGEQKAATGDSVSAGSNAGEDVNGQGAEGQTTDGAQAAALPDPVTPIAAQSYENGAAMNWLWLLGAAAAAGAGVYGYEKQKKKVAANEEAKKYKK